MSDTDTEIRVALAALETKVTGMSDRLDNMERDQKKLLELASFGKGSLKTMTLLGLCLGGLAGVAIAIKTWV